MRSESKSVYASFKNDRERLWALVSRDLRIVAVSALRAGCANLNTA